jgi:hypothetical protein
MLTISGILLIAALLMVLWHAANPPRIPLWIPLLITIIAALIQFIPIK